MLAQALNTAIELLATSQRNPLVRRIVVYSDLQTSQIDKERMG